MDRRNELYQLLGRVPDRNYPVKAELCRRDEYPDYFLERLMLDLNGIEQVSAFVVIPKNLKAPAPAVLYNHAHGGAYHTGKNELIDGVDYLFKQPVYAEELARRGYVVLCIDAWNFGERRGRTESELFKEMLWKGQVLWGMMVFDSIKALDYLSLRPEVDTSRIATLGISMGSTMAWWTAALDTRIKVTVDIGCLTDFDSLIEHRGLDYHGVYYYVPDLLNHFTTAQINALIAPRPHLALAGNYDPLTPPDGLDRINAELTKVYSELNAADAWKLLRYNTGHFESAAMRVEILKFLDKWL